MQLEQLHRFLQSLEPAAQLVEPRVLRRVIRLDRRLPAFRLTIPHELGYTIERDRLLAFADPSELAIRPASDLPRRVILLPQPDEFELIDDTNWAALTDRYRRLLFHECVHLEIESHLREGAFPDGWARARREKIGAVEFAEIRDVLLKEDLLINPADDAETYVEFAAVALELRCLAPQDLPSFFPSIRDWQDIEQILAQDLDLPRLFERFGGSGDDPEAALHAPVGPTCSFGENGVAGEDASVNLPAIRKPPTGTVLSDAVGRGLQTALSRLRGPGGTATETAAETAAATEAELRRLVERLQEVLGLSDAERESWRSALHPLLRPAADGFWSNERRLLYDLQKVCFEQQRGVYRLDPVGWIRSLGRRPLRRPLPLMQDVLSLRHLRKVRRRTAMARVTAAERDRLLELVDGVLPLIEARSRERLRRIINEVFDAVDFVPGNVPEIVARRKTVEELVDRIIERSYVTMADVRDAISKNDLKLADVTTLSELMTGTSLLRADRQFDTALDGVYRRGAVYLRWPQRLSSVAFGTRFGRFLTQRLIVPFGGAYLLLAFISHTVAMLSGHREDAAVAAVHESTDAGGDVTGGFDPPSVSFALAVLLLGMWLSMLIHRPEFRAWNAAILHRGWRLVRHVLIDLPSTLLNSPLVQRALRSRSFALLRSYILEPWLLAGLIYLLLLLQGARWDGRTFLELFLLSALFLNSAVGRAIAERTSDLLMRAWQDLKMHFFAALVRGIMDVFDRLFTLLEQIVYTVDEWLRFRAGDNRATQAIKLAGGIVWFLVSYVVVFVFTLLVEPQINPIKHFPVVTVAHKLILPTGPVFVAILSPYLGGAWAQTLVWTTIWLVPGVFGFLVWELRENWRLYAANRPLRPGPSAIGEHGETMLRLLRPGIHSGTLPKAFAALRRAMEKRGGREQHRVQRKRAVITHVETAVRHFVERELIALLEVAEVLPAGQVSVGGVHAATNRIDVELVSGAAPNLPMRLTWELRGGDLVGAVDPVGWRQTLPEPERQRLSVALAELFQRSGVDRVQGPLPLRISPPLSWKEAVSFWSMREAPQELVAASASR